MKLSAIHLLCMCFFLSSPALAKDELELETTFIKGNKELPQIMYVVPWKDMQRKRNEAQHIVLHSLFGDIFDPVKPGKLDNTR